MRRSRRTGWLAVALLVAASLVGCGSASSASKVTMASCGDFTGWVWAQTVFDGNRGDLADDLDPDGNGIACDQLLPTPGYAPALWTETLPADLVEARLLYVIDGDTIQVTIDGVETRVRFYRSDTPEEYETKQCGADEAIRFTSDLLSVNEGGATIALEYDDFHFDKYGRTLAYVWLVIDGRPVMLNEALIRAGWAQDVDYGDHRYDRELVDAADFAERYQVGVYAACGAFELPVGGPTTGSTNPAMGIAAGVGGVFQLGEPWWPASTPCDRHYPDACIPDLSAYGDLDCADIPWRQFAVLEPDPQNFDSDGNGLGCENPAKEYRPR